MFEVEKQMIKMEKTSNINDETFSMFWSRPKSGYSVFADRKSQQK